MFNAERLLGRMVTRGIRRQTRTIGAGAIGLGLLGVAIAAIGHFSKAGESGKTPPPPPSGAKPPPPPPPPAPGDGGVPSPQQSQALLLLRAMVSAAAADGKIDADERKAILGHLLTAGADDQERRFIEEEMNAPAPVEEIARAGKQAGMEEQVYGACLLAIDVDTDAEREFLARLAEELGLDAAAVSGLHRQLGVPERR